MAAADSAAAGGRLVEVLTVYDGPDLGDLAARRHVVR